MSSSNSHDFIQGNIPRTQPQQNYANPILAVKIVCTVIAATLGIVILRRSFEYLRIKRIRSRQRSNMQVDDTGLPFYEEMGPQIDQLRATRRRMTPFGARTWALHNIHRVTRRERTAGGTAALPEYDVVAQPPPTYQPRQDETVDDIANIPEGDDDMFDHR